MFKILKQDIYPTPVDGLFIIKLEKDDNDSKSEDSFYLDLIGFEFEIDFQTYKVITIMQDVPTSDYFMLCRLLILK